MTVVERAPQLAAALAQAGAISDPSWREAFAAVRREVFVPAFEDEDGQVVTGADPARRQQWLDAVYSDTTLVTRSALVPGTDLRWAVSSSTRPGLMAAMLELLEVTGTERVLEIGTGTGYNAALLCHRLGDARVTSVDLDPGLVSAARTRLAEHGFHPRLAVADGRDGFPDAAPYDRILATAAVRDIPRSWIIQLAAGGLIVADVRGEVAGSLVALRRTAAGTVEGRFRGRPGHFMWLRADPDNPLRDGGRLRTEFRLPPARRTTTTLDPATLADPGLRFVLQFSAPGLEAVYADGEVVRLQAEDGVAVGIGTVPDGAGRYPVTGTGDLATVAERAAQRWRDLGRPGVDRFGLTARADGRRTFWLDEPGQPLDWM